MEKASLEHLFSILSLSPAFTILYYRPRVQCGKVRPSFCGSDKYHCEAVSTHSEEIKIVLKFSKSEEWTGMQMKHGGSLSYCWTCISNIVKVSFDKCTGTTAYDPRHALRTGSFGRQQCPMAALWAPLLGTDGHFLGVSSFQLLSLAHSLSMWPSATANSGGFLFWAQVLFTLKFRLSLQVWSYTLLKRCNCTTDLPC